MSFAEHATEVDEMVWKGWVESIEEMSSGNKLIRIRGGNTEAVLELPCGMCDATVLTPQSVVETTSVSRPGKVPLINDLRVLNYAENLPVDMTKPDFADTRYRHLHIRTPQLRAAAMFRHFLQKHIREYLEGMGFYHVHTPILTEASCVCSGDVFAFPYYSKKIANLIQSPWMYADALVSGVERVYALNPSFRREKEATNIHLVEIWQLQVDLTWATNEDVMALEEGMLKHIAKQFLEKHKDLYVMAGLNPAHLADLLKPYQRITYDESLARLRSLGYDLPYGSDYSKEQSDALSSTFTAPYFVTEYPQELKNFWFPSYEVGERRLVSCQSRSTSVY